MNKVIEFVPRPYRNRKTRKLREIEAEKILNHREAIIKKREELHKQLEEKRAVTPPSFANLGEELAGGKAIAGIQPTNTKDPD